MKIGIEMGTKIIALIEINIREKNMQMMKHYRLAHKLRNRLRKALLKQLTQKN